MVDSAKNSYNTSLSEIKKRVTPKTKAIQITHSAGEPVPDIKAIELCERKSDFTYRGL